MPAKGASSILRFKAPQRLGHTRLAGLARRSNQRIRYGDFPPSRGSRSPRFIARALWQAPT